MNQLGPLSLVVGHVASKHSITNNQTSKFRTKTIQIIE